MTGGEITDFGALGAGIGEPLPDLENRHSRPGVDPVGDEPLPRQSLVGTGAERHGRGEEAPVELDPAAHFPVHEIQPLCELAPRLVMSR